MKRAGRHGWWLAALAVFVVCAALHALGALRPVDDAFADLRARWLMREVRSDLVIVGIDDATRAALGQPMPRRYHAQLLDQLARAAPRSVFLDVDLGTLAAPEEDLALETRLAMPRDFPVVLPAFLATGPGQSPELRMPRARFARRTEHAAVPERPSRGLTRTWRTSWDVRGVREQSVIDRDRRLPDGHEVIIDYSISPASFIQVSFIDVIEGQVPREVFAGKKVFVGATAPDAGVGIPVPLHGSLPRIVVQALATETVIQGAPRVLPGWSTAALLASWTSLVAAAMAVRGAARRRRNVAALAIGLTTFGTVALFLLAPRGIHLDVAAPLLAVLLLIVARGGSGLMGRLRRALGDALGFRQRDALLRSIVQSSTDCIVCMDEAGIIQTANPAASRLFDCPGHELVGEPISKFIALLAGDDAAARLGGLHGVVRECDARTARGEVFPVEISVSRLRLTSAWLYTAVVRDIRDRRAQQRRLQHQATHDPLTGLPNRAALMAHLEESLARAAGTPMALLMLDLCRFKEVNDTLGHGVGDRVLCDVAQRFAATLAGRGFIARIGGDEFTVVLGAPESAHAVAAASQQLADCLSRPIDVAGIAIEVGVSIGVARFPQDGSDAQALLRHADVAMYVAKRRGATCEFYTPSYEENTARNLAIGGELRAAIAGNRLELHYQPQVNLRSGLVDSCEALLRWTHPTHGVVSPKEFVAIAESTDLIRPLTEWTLSSALSQCRAWRDRGVHVRVAVNLSARLLQDTAFPRQVRELLAASGVSAASLELEITESALMLDPSRALRVLSEIDELGVRIVIDDFGTGYSSLGYLRDLPVDALKLDHSFVMGMRSHGDDRLIVESAAKMAQALRLELVAEGVQTEWDAAFLKATGFDSAQGFRYSRAMPADEFMAWVVDHNTTAMLTGGDMGFMEAAPPASRPSDPERNAGFGGAI